MSSIRPYLTDLKSNPCSFATVGMFSAVSNLGAGGLSDITLSDTSQGVLYGLFAVTGLISGGINNRTTSSFCIWFCILMSRYHV